LIAFPDAEASVLFQVVDAVDALSLRLAEASAGKASPPKCQDG